MIFISAFITLITQLFGNFEDKIWSWKCCKSYQRVYN